MDLREKPGHISVLFQNGEWVGEFRYRQITLSSLLSLALFVGEKINEKTSSGEVFLFFSFLFFSFSFLSFPFSLFFSSLFFSSLLFSSLLFSCLLFSPLLFSSLVFSFLFFSFLFFSFLFFSFLFFSFLFFSFLFFSSFLFLSSFFICFLFYFLCSTTQTPFPFLSFFQTSTSYFVLDTSGHDTDAEIGTNDDSAWPLTLFFERKNVWLEQTSADLKSQGILAGDVLELKVKPKLVRVFIGVRSKMLKYMPSTSVQDVIEELYQGGDKKDDVCNYGIFLSHNGKRFDEGGQGLWLAADKRLASYNLSFNDSLYFSQLPEQQRQNKKTQTGFFFFFLVFALSCCSLFCFIFCFIFFKTQPPLPSLTDPPKQLKSVVVVDTFTSTPYQIPFDFDTTVKDVIITFLQRVPHKHYLSIISDLSLYLPAHDDCMCMPYCLFFLFFPFQRKIVYSLLKIASKIQTTTINDPLTPATPLPMRCIHGKWLKENSLLSQASLLKCDHLELRQKRRRKEGGREKRKNSSTGLVEKLQLLPKLGIDEEDKMQRQFMGHSGLLAEVAVVLRPVNGEGKVGIFFFFAFFFSFFSLPSFSSFSLLKVNFLQQEPKLWERLFIPISLSTTARDLKKSIELLAPSLTLPTPDTDATLFILNRKKFPKYSLRIVKAPDPDPLDIPSLFLDTQQSTFSFSEIRSLPTTSESDLVFSHLAGESVLFVFGYGKAFRSASSQTVRRSALKSAGKGAKKTPPCRFVVNVSFREENKTTSVGFEHKTTVKDLFEYLSKMEEEKSQDQEGKKAAFGVFLATGGGEGGNEEGEEGFWLKEKRTLVSYGLLDQLSSSDASSADPVFPCECEATRSVIWKRKPVHIDASVFPHLLAFKSGKNTPNQPVLLGENTDVFSNRFFFHFFFTFFLLLFIYYYYYYYNLCVF